MSMKNIEKMTSTKYRVIKSVSDFSFNEEPFEPIPKIEKEKKTEKRLSLEALGEERRLKNQAKKERMKRNRLKRIEKLSEMSQTDDFVPNFSDSPVFGVFYPIKRPPFDKTDDEIFEKNILTLGQRAKIYQEYEFKKEKMNAVLDQFCSNLKTEDGRPVRLILIDDSKCFKEAKIEKKKSKIEISRNTNEENWEERLKNRIKEDRAQLDKLLFELKKEVEETNKQKRLLKEQKKMKKEKMRDKKLMIKLLKERIKEENRSEECLEKKNVILNGNTDEKMLISGSKHILNIEPVKNMLFRMISRKNKSELEELGDKMEEECFKKMAKNLKRKEGKMNRKKLKICEVKEPRKVDVKISEEDWSKRKKERRKSENWKRYNGRIMEIWREMIKKHSVEKTPPLDENDGMVEIDLKNEPKPEKVKEKRNFKTKLKLPPLRFGRNTNFLKTPTLNPLTVK